MSKIVVLGASYGSLLGIKLLLAGHDVMLVCLPEEAELINRDGTRVRMPIKGRDDLVELDSRDAPGTLRAGGPEEVDPADYDLVGLAMQEPQYSHPEVRALVERTAAARVPCMSIMNMPALPFLRRVEKIDAEACREAYTDPEIWDGFEPGLMTMCSPDPQAIRPPDEPPNVLQVRLPTNFKAADFESDEHTALLERLEADVAAVRYRAGDEEIELPVKLRCHDSIYVPMAKWAMLLAGNYRCIQEDGIRPTREAIQSDPEEAEAVYNWVLDVCKALGADDGDLVPFEKYAAAADMLGSPASVARALDGGAPRVERVDKLVQIIAAGQGMHNDAVDRIVALVDARLEANQRVAA
jgi:hypothetical protein